MKSVLGYTDIGATGALSLLTLLLLTPCMYMHGSTLVYIYIYIYIRRPLDRGATRLRGVCLILYPVSSASLYPCIFVSFYACMLVCCILYPVSYSQQSVGCSCVAQGTVLDLPLGMWSGFGVLLASQMPLDASQMPPRCLRMPSVRASN